MSPLSLTHLQVGIGGQNVLNCTLNMTYENFLQQVNLAEQFTSSDFGVSTGLISQGYWEQSKWYFVNVERGNIADKLQPRNINVSFNNNSNVPIDVIIFTFYSDQLEWDMGSVFGSASCVGEQCVTGCSWTANQLSSQERSFFSTV